MKLFLGRRIVWLILVASICLGVLSFFKWRENVDRNAIQAMSWALASRVVVVDPGHGGEDPGKISPGGIYEKDINLAVAHKLSMLLHQGGAMVIMTREKDKALSSGEDTIRERKRADLRNRVELANGANAHLYISLHCNSFPAGRWHGAQTFYSPFIEGSKDLSKYVQEELEKTLGNTNRKPKQDNSSIIMKNAKVPIINVEMGFLSNPQEERLLQDSAYQDKIAWAVYSGIVRYLVEYGDTYHAALQRVNK